jgi:hypothetical protein
MSNTETAIIWNLTEPLQVTVRLSAFLPRSTAIVLDESYTRPDRPIPVFRARRESHLLPLQ